VVQTRQEKRENDAVQSAHWVVSLLKRWLLGTHGGAVKTRHLQSYLDEFQFRYNRCKTNGVARLTARAIERLVAEPVRSMKKIIKEPRTYRALPEATA
jgi:hypothetical protein